MKTSFRLPTISVVLLATIAACAGAGHATPGREQLSASSTEGHPDRAAAHELRSRVTELEGSLASESRSLSQTQRLYDDLADEVERVMQLQAVPENMLALQQMIARGRAVEQNLRDQKREVSRLTAELAEARATLAQLPSVPPGR